MSWLARSIANSLRLDDDDEDDASKPNTTASNDDPKSPLKSESDPHQPDPQSQSSTPASTTTTTPRGVKEDLSELTKTISRQFWGVASFLAPPPEPEPEPEKSRPQSQISDPDPADEDLIAGIRSDFAEIGGKFRSGISKLSGNKAVSEFTKIASNFLQLGPEEERPLHEYDLDGVVGITEDVVAFARNIAMHPETWLDFPLPDDPDSDEFELSDAQQEHALAVERLAPRLAALRMDLCPGYMSDGFFWKIYFVLLHPRLNKNDALLLSSPQIMETRAMLTQALDKRRKEKKEADLSSGEGNVEPLEVEHHLSVPRGAQLESDHLQTSAVEAARSVVVSDVEMEKHPVQSTETKIIDKPVVKEAPVNPTAEQSSSSTAKRIPHEMDEDDADDWLNEDTSEIVGTGRTSIPTTNEDDVSFSDLEDDDGDVPASYKKATSGSDSSTKESRDWVQLSNSDKDINSVESRHSGSEHGGARNSESKDSNDWLNVDDIDVI